MNKKLFGVLALVGACLLAAVPSSALALDPVLTIPDTLHPVGIANSLMVTAGPIVVALLGLSLILGLAVMIKRVISRKARGIAA